MKLHEVILIYGEKFMNNVINFKKSKIEFPEDLISFKGFADKHKMKVGYLYKLWRKGYIKRHKRGVWKISESETLIVLYKLGLQRVG